MLFDTISAHTRFQRFISFVVLFFFLFQLAFHVPVSLFSRVAANEKPYSDIVAILASESIYDDLQSQIRRYGNDIQGVLPATRALIFPTPDDATPFQIASLLEKLYYDGYAGIDASVSYDSKLVGTVLVGDIPLPSVYNGSSFASTLLPYVDFKDKQYLYSHEDERYILSEANQGGIEAEIWHGVISSNPSAQDDDGNRRSSAQIYQEKVTQIKDYFDKNHDFYEAQGLFDPGIGVVSGDPSQSLDPNYEPHVFYYDQFVEKKSIHTQKYRAYQAWLENREDIAYHRFSDDLAERIEDRIYGSQDEQVAELLEKVAPELADTQRQYAGERSKFSSDISSLSSTLENIKQYVEVFSGPTLANFRKGGWYAGRYSSSGNDIRVDTVAKLLTLMDENSVDTLQAANNDIENYIDQQLQTRWAKEIFVPTTYQITSKNSSNNLGSCSTRIYTHYSYGIAGTDISHPAQCSIYRGSNWNFRENSSDYDFAGQIVEANRGRNVTHASDDAALCGPELRVSAQGASEGVQGYWGGSSPINFYGDETTGEFRLGDYDVNASVRPLYDITGALEVPAAQIDAYSFHVGLSNGNPNLSSTCEYADYILTYGGKYSLQDSSGEDASCEAYFFEEAPKELFNCSSEHQVLRDYNGLTLPTQSTCVSFQPGPCSRVICQIEGEGVYYDSGDNSCYDEEDGTGSLTTHTFTWKSLGSQKILEHKSPTASEIAAQSQYKITPSLPIDTERHVEFIGKTGTSNLRLFYPNYFRAADIYLDSGNTGYSDISRSIQTALVPYHADMTRQINAVLSEVEADASFDLDGLMKQGQFSDLASYSLLGEQKDTNFYATLANALHWYQLGSLGNKYHYIFDHYLSDGFGDPDQGFALPENKKLYEMVYLNAPGDERHMFLNMFPDQTSDHPYVQELQKKQELRTALIAKILSDGSDNANIPLSCSPPLGVNPDTYIPPIGCRASDTSTTGQDIQIEEDDDTASDDLLFSAHHISTGDEGLWTRNTFYVKASDENNIFLFDENKQKPRDLQTAVWEHNSATEKLLIGVTGYENGNYQDLAYPLRVQVSRGGVSLLKDTYVRSELDFYAPLFTASQTGVYELRVIDARGQEGNYDFHVMPNSAANISTSWGARVMESGSETTNTLLLRDNFGNPSHGILHRVVADISGDSLEFIVTSDPNRFEQDTFSGELSFGLKATAQTGRSRVTIEVQDVSGSTLYEESIDIRVVGTLSVGVDAELFVSSDTPLSVGGDSYELDIELRDENANLVSDYNGRGVLSFPSAYGSLTSGSGEVDFQNGRAQVTLQTSDLAGQNIALHLVAPGLSRNISFGIDILPEAAIGMDMILQKPYLSAVEDDEMIVQVELKDQFGNRVWSDNSSQISIELPDEYRGDISLSTSRQRASAGVAEFQVRSSGLSNTVYLKASAPSSSFRAPIRLESSDGSENLIEAVPYAIGKIESSYSWDGSNNARYNGLYSVMLGAPYGNYTSPDYLAGKILFDRDNRALSVTSMLNDPYADNQVLSISQGGAIQVSAPSSDLLQDIDIDVSLDHLGYLQTQIRNRALNTHIGGSKYLLDTLTGVSCPPSISDLSDCVLEEGSSVVFQSLRSGYETYTTSNSVVLREPGTSRKIFSALGNGRFEMHQAMRIEHTETPGVFSIIVGGQAVAQFLLNLEGVGLNLSSDRSLFEAKQSRIKDTLLVYIDHFQYSGSLQNTDTQHIRISYLDTLSTDPSLDVFHADIPSGFENSVNRENLGWEGENTALLSWSAGDHVGQSTRDFMSFSLVNLGDPVLKIYNQAASVQTSSEAVVVRGFDSTVGKLIDRHDDIRSYQAMDYNGDGQTDIVGIDSTGHIRILENIAGSPEFHDRGSLLYLVDMGDPKQVFAGDFVGDGYDDIFFVDYNGQPVLIENRDGVFQRHSLRESFGLAGHHIILARVFDMDDDSISDIITLDSQGNISIWYGRASSRPESGTPPTFTQSIVDNSLGIGLDTAPRSDGGLIYFDGLYQIPDRKELGTPSGSDTGLDAQAIRLMDSVLYHEVPYRLDENSEDIRTTFLRSQYAAELGARVQKTFSSASGSLLPGSPVEVQIRIANTGGKRLSNLIYMEQVDEFLELQSDTIEVSGASQPSYSVVAGYDFTLEDLSLAPDEVIEIRYSALLRPITYGYLDVGYFERGNIGDDRLGDIILKSDHQNCGTNYTLYSSLGNREYSADFSKPECIAPDDPTPTIEDLNQIDEDANGVPDYIDAIEQQIIDAGPEALSNPSQDSLLSALSYDSDGDGVPDIDDRSPSYNASSSGLSGLQAKVDDVSDDLDDLIAGLCGSFTRGNIAGPLNWAPLAPGSDPVLYGYPIGDGLKVNEGYPVFSSLTGNQTTCGKAPCCLPSVHPRHSQAYIPGPFCGPNSAGGKLGTWSPFNTLRIFVTPTLTGAVGVAVCRGGPAIVQGNIPPPGVSPLVSGGNCIVKTSTIPLGQKTPYGDITPGRLLSGGSYILDNNPLGGFQGISHWGPGGQVSASLGTLYANCGLDFSGEKDAIENRLSRDYVGDYLKLRQQGTREIILPPTLSKQTGAILSGEKYTGGATGPYNAQKPLIQIGDPGSQHSGADFGVSLDTSKLRSGDFSDVIQIENTRVTPFPDFMMDWVTRQVEEIVVKLTDLPTLHIILPSFDHLGGDDWGEFKSSVQQATSGGVNIPTKDQIKNAKSVEDAGIVSEAQITGIKEAYNFLSNVPYINIEEKIVYIDIPVPSTDLDGVAEHWDATVQQWNDEIETTKQEWGGIDENNVLVDADDFVRTLHKNKEILESYADIPQQVADVLNIKQVWMEQIISSVEALSEMMGGWIYRNGKTFRNWVQAYLLIKNILTSWQIIIDIFNDYDYQCRECKNERYDLQYFIWKLIGAVIPKIPIIRFPKWPDFILDLHHVRLGLNITLPEFRLNYRPFTLPRLPELDLPSDPNITLEIPKLPLLPKFVLPTLPRLPEFPSFELPNLPPAPTIPKLFASFEGVLDVFKLILQVMCLLRQSPRVPEWRAGDQIAFLTERLGFSPFDFIDISFPEFALPAFDGNKITTYLNLEYETDFILKATDPLSEVTKKFSSDIVHKIRANKIADTVGIDAPDDIDIGVDGGEVDVDISHYDSATLWGLAVAQGLSGLQTALQQQQHETVSVPDFIELARISLSKSPFQESQGLAQIQQNFDLLASYDFAKEQAFIDQLTQTSRDRFATLTEILEIEKDRNETLMKRVHELRGGDVFEPVSQTHSNIEAYQDHIAPYNDAFVAALRGLQTSPEVSDISDQGKELIDTVSSGLLSYSENLLASQTDAGSVTTGSTNACEPLQNHNYSGVYVLEEKQDRDINYLLFQYLEDLNGEEEITRRDLDNDGDEDIIYLSGDRLYVKYNYDVAAVQQYITQTPEVVSIRSNPYLNGSDYYESLDHITEPSASHKHINISFAEHPNSDIRNYRLALSPTLDGAPQQLIDILDVGTTRDLGFISRDEDGLYERYDTLATVTSVGNLPSTSLKTSELKNLVDDIAGDTLVSIAPETAIYAGSKSIRMGYIDHDGIREDINIPAFSSVVFDQAIKVVSLSSDAYVMTGQDIVLAGADIRDYIGLPLDSDSVIQTGQGPARNEGGIQIRYYDGNTLDIDPNTIKSYTLLHTDDNSPAKALRLAGDNGYYYGSITGFNGEVISSSAHTGLFAPQAAADIFPPEINYYDDISFSIGTTYTLDLTDFIIEDSGIENIDFIEVDMQGVEVIQTPSRIQLVFGPYDTPVDDTMRIRLTDTAGNEGYRDIPVRVEVPTPRITSYQQGVLSGTIGAEIEEVPVTVYRYRRGALSEVDQDDISTGSSLTDTLGDFEQGTFESTSGLRLSGSGTLLASIDEWSGDIDTVAATEFSYRVDNSSGFPQIIASYLGDPVYYFYPRMGDQARIQIGDDFSVTDPFGMYLSFSNKSLYGYYQIPDQASYNAGAVVIYRNSSVAREPLFTLYPDGRVESLNDFYDLEYRPSGDGVIRLTLIDRNFDREVAQLFYHLGDGYILDRELYNIE